MVLAPEAPLDADAEYVVHIGVDEAARFTTGSTFDDTPPDFDGLHGMTASWFEPSGSLCHLGNTDGFHQLTLDYDQLPPDLLYGVLSVRRASETTAFHVMPVRNRPRSDNFPMPRVIASTRCGPRPPELDPGETYCATLTAVDGSGNTAGGDVEVCATAQRCEPTGDLRGQCTPASGCRATPDASGSPLTPLLLLAAALLVRRHLRPRIPRR